MKDKDFRCKVSQWDDDDGNYRCKEFFIPCDGLSDDRFCCPLWTDIRSNKPIAEMSIWEQVDD